jgi:hypothetical protein
MAPKWNRPKVFIASSVKNKRLAYEIQQNLDDDADVTVWDQNVFRLTKSSLENLLVQLDKSDFAIFVFAPDDVVRIGRARLRAVRDNVVFELGLFMGRLGILRTFIVAPKGRKHLRIPSDLAGVTLGTFNTDRADRDTRAALGPFCHDVRQALRKHGPVGGTSRRKSRPPAVRPSGGLRIIEALYGARGHRVNVAHKLNSLIKRGHLNVYVGNQLGGDPCPGVKKDLVVQYTLRGLLRTVVVTEGDDLVLASGKS